MEPTGLLSLPVEVLHNIIQYLSVQDVLNCSGTCYYLRMAFNDDRVWRKFVPVEVLQLESQDQLLQPTFQWEGALTPLCDYRVHLNHLMNNWNTAKVAKYTIQTKHSYASFVLQVPKGRGHTFYKDRYLFLGRLTNDIHSDGVEVWDLGREPVMHSFLGITNINYECFYIIGSNLVVVECKAVCVYQICLPESHYPLLYSFVITKSEAALNGEDVHQEICDTRCDGWSHYNIGQYLISNQCDDDGKGSIIHVWDIVNATKVGDFTLPVDGWCVSVDSHEEDEWLLRERFEFSNDSLYFLFNIKQKTISETGFKISEGYPNQTILYKSHIITFSYIQTQSSDGYNYTDCVVYDLKTSEVKKRCFNNPQGIQPLSSIAIVSGSFILHGVDCFQKIDALTLETIYQFRSELDIPFIKHQFHIFGSTFVVASSRDGKLYIWNVTMNKNSTRPMLVDNSLFINNYTPVYYTMTKLVILECDCHKVSVVHFW